MSASTETCVPLFHSNKHLTKSWFGKIPTAQNQTLQDLVRPHIDSFNWVLSDGLSTAIRNVQPAEFELPNKDRIAISIEDATISLPTVAQGNVTVSTLKVYPTECRERLTTYKGKLQATITWRINGRTADTFTRPIGEVPVMVKSNACNLARLNPSELVKHGEEVEEMGGYFIANGIEKVIRMLIMPRRNFPLCTIRNSWKKRGPLYTEYGVTMRCVRSDQTTANMVLHYLLDGSANLCFFFQKQMFFAPLVVILKALVDVTDLEIYNELIKGKEDDSFYKSCMSSMLRQAQEIYSTRQAELVRYIGNAFRVQMQVPSFYTDTQAGHYLLSSCICIHLKSNREKFDVLVFMTRKLFALAHNECCAESADNPANQEVLLSGHLFLMVLKEKVEGWLQALQLSIKKIISTRGKTENVSLTPKLMTDALGKVADITRAMDYLISTGNLVSKTGLGLMQTTGFAVVADKLNFMRYLSHFRSVHRGAFFAEMRTTAVRKLLPEAWGFLCPVHTPDGAPCGLLNHLAVLAQIANVQVFTGHLPGLLISLGMLENDASLGRFSSHYPVMLDGKMIGWIAHDAARKFANILRYFKVTQQERVPRLMEICLVEKTEVASQYPALYLFTSMARMVRPVINLATKTVEMIGTFEQVYLNICLKPEEAVHGVTTHQELSETCILSDAAALIPFPDFNQSPRNMYQCQMGKQTMGTPLHAFGHRSDNKLYRLLFPQSALVRPQSYEMLSCDNYPSGTNAIVAVISYTGYDMEDAMIINKASYQRGFAHGMVYKCEMINLKTKSNERGPCSLRFCGNPSDELVKNNLDSDGLPPIGTYLQQGDPYYSYMNLQTGLIKVERFKGMESAYVEQIKILGSDTGKDELTKVVIQLRINRNPIIGDKFASRHGQKGICSKFWPVEDLPFTESGMVPDIIFNPHGFPSRMTIGMMIEAMAGKSAAMHGIIHDSTPFTFSEENSASDFFGKSLCRAGYNYYGTERMYSGVDGREMEVDIFFGLVYYQRLRHMVADKYQVRTTGPVDALTQQPIKGRKRAGGVRFGEMERDSLLAHGSSFLIQDRLFECSDKTMAKVCKHCGSLLSTMIEESVHEISSGIMESELKWTCHACKRGDGIELISIPHVFRYLVAELAAMSIKVKLDLH